MTLILKVLCDSRKKLLFYLKNDQRKKRASADNGASYRYFGIQMDDKQFKRLALFELSTSTTTVKLYCLKEYLIQYQRKRDNDSTNAVFVDINPLLFMTKLELIKKQGNALPQTIELNVS